MTAPEEHPPRTSDLDFATATNSHRVESRLIEEGSYLDLINLLLRYRRWIVAVSLGMGVVFAAIAVLKAPIYTSRASLLPQQNSSAPSRLSGLAAQMGINVGTPDVGQSPAFYGTLLETREILEPAVQTTYRFRSGSDSVVGNLIQLLKAKGSTPAERLESALADLDKRITVDVYPQTGLVQLKVATPWAPLSYQVADTILGLVNAFNISRRQAQAKLEADFAEQLVAQSRSDLRQAENQLQDFLERNRTYQSDPQLAFEHDRLQRAVEMRQDVYTGLFQSFQQARIDAVRDTPPMTVVEKPHVPAKPDPRHVPIRALLGLVVGAVLAIFFAVLHNSMARSRSAATPSSEQYAVLRREAVQDVRRLFRLRR
ncbi:MAG TPA: Wzz/FepE/Etk N-terminal domain-containing protein [Gemmatimonadaceae bacterium]|nr:Wzz/FepE/Etk N-terminal domain-containing protein [Gemmatimonadaceae bacterium]